MARNKEKPNIIWQPQAGSQALYMQCPIFEVLYEGTRGGGKGQPMDSGVYTPSGLKKMKDMKVGSVILNPNGSHQEVIGVYPQGLKDVYRITFSDGATVEADDEHLWAHWFAGRKVKGRETYPHGWMQEGENFEFGKLKLATTEMLLEELKRNRERKWDSLPLIPATLPLAFNRITSPSIRRHKVDAYLLGLLLGDGYIVRKTGASFTTNDIEFGQYVIDKGFTKTNAKRDNEYIISYDAGRELQENLNFFGLLGTLPDSKFIPNEYKYDKIENRRFLLSGLMDTDGTVDIDGRVSYTTVSKRLASDVKFLVESLGGWATISPRAGSCKKDDGTVIKCRMAYVLYIQMPNKADIFRLSRKKRRCEGRDCKFRPYRKIVDIEHIGKKECQCIKVDNPNGLYLTDHCIVTHNTDCLLMSFAQHCGKGYGRAWRGILFRQSYKQLTDIIDKSKKWFPRIFKNIKYNAAEYVWKWKDGEELLLRYMDDPRDYNSYHGHEYPFVGWEELTNWPDSECYESMKACCRSSHPDVPRMYRSTANPYGIGVHWVRAYFVNPAPSGQVITNIAGRKRVRISSSILENKILMQADPDYYRSLVSIEDPQKRKAWLMGDWNAMDGGGALEGCWNSATHILQPFVIPKTWRIFRAFDWGSSAPFYVGFFAESNGEEVIMANGEVRSFPKGTLFLISEWAGNESDDKLNTGIEMLTGDIAIGINEIAESLWFRELTSNGTLRAGPADSSIFDESNGVSLAADMALHGVGWEKADKSPGSRVAGLERFRKLLTASKQHPMEDSGFFVFSTCKYFLSTVPTIPRDEKNPEDVKTKKYPDHAWDVVRYVALMGRALKGGFKKATY